VIYVHPSSDSFTVTNVLLTLSLAFSAEQLYEHCLLNIPLWNIINKKERQGHKEAGPLFISLRTNKGILVASNTAHLLQFQPKTKGTENWYMPLTPSPIPP
jgi:hypothetical protein